MAAVVAKIWVNAAYIFILFYKYVTSPRLWLLSPQKCAPTLSINHFVLQICNLSEAVVAVAAKTCANAIYTSLVYNMQPLRGWVISSRNTL